MLRFGLFGLHRGGYADPDLLARRAAAAEAAGFESLWVGDHIAAPAAGSGGRTLDGPRMEAVVALTFMAARTARVRLGAGVIVLPQRQPVVLAKQLATLDVLSGGRLIVGIGAGWLEPELAAAGVSMAERGARTDEYLTVMRALWTGEPVSHKGRYVAFDQIQGLPAPAQRPHPPIVVGGYAPASYRRAVTLAAGWYGYSIDLDRTAAVLADLRRAQERYPRPADLGELEITVSPPPGPVDAATAERYAALGVHRLVILPPSLEAPALDHLIESTAALIGRV
ncbi:MAG: TIGR03619 family F420-dependent LLM class oxidoreductase [Dehalococcoidia bacterium]